MAGLFNIFLFKLEPVLIFGSKFFILSNYSWGTPLPGLLCISKNFALYGEFILITNLFISSGVNVLFLRTFKLLCGVFWLYELFDFSIIFNVNIASLLND